MVTIKIADLTDLDSIAELRTEQQIEDWNKTGLDKDFSGYAGSFSEITKNHLLQTLNKSIYFAIMYLADLPIAMCALEETDELPQITICEKPASHSGSIVSVYTKPDYRGRGYQQKLLKELLTFAKKQNFTDITLTTNTDDAKHIYEKLGFKYISDKYYLKL